MYTHNCIYIYTHMFSYIHNIIIRTYIYIYIHVCSLISYVLNIHAVDICDGHLLSTYLPGKKSRLVERRSELSLRQAKAAASASGGKKKYAPPSEHRTHLFSPVRYNRKDIYIYIIFIHLYIIYVHMYICMYTHTMVSFSCVLLFIVADISYI